jgi:hypothetical protein
MAPQHPSSWRTRLQTIEMQVAVNVCRHETDVQTRGVRSSHGRPCVESLGRSCMRQAPHMPLERGIALYR